MAHWGPNRPNLPDAIYMNYFMKIFVGGANTSQRTTTDSNTKFQTKFEGQTSLRLHHCYIIKSNARIWYMIHFVIRSYFLLTSYSTSKGELHVKRICLPNLWEFIQKPIMIVHIASISHGLVISGATLEGSSWILAMPMRMRLDVCIGRLHEVACLILSNLHWSMQTYYGDD